MDLDLIQKIKDLKEEKNAYIVAHLYQRGEIQDLADEIGDSYYLSKKVMETDKNLIVFCGVRFMADSAKILSPDKKILLSAKNARCPMADMTVKSRVLKLKEQNPNAKVVSYINTHIDIKEISDVCVTSSSAVDILKNMEDKEILFVPDRNLGQYIAEQVPDKKFTFYPGFCPIHERIEASDIIPLKERHPDYEILVHPECNKEVRDLAQFVGSTSEIIQYTSDSSSTGFIVVTEEGVVHQMKKDNPQKDFLTVECGMICPNMKMTTLEELYDCLLNETNEIILDEEQRKRALRSLENMHLLSSK